MRSPELRCQADFARKRQLLVFDRFVARVVDVLGDAVMLEGGLVETRVVARPEPGALASAIICQRRVIAT